MIRKPDDKFPASLESLDENDLFCSINHGANCLARQIRMVLPSFRKKTRKGTERKRKY